jgi:enoyl-CoA hydratase/carnithine racemase
MAASGRFPSSGRPAPSARLADIPSPIGEGTTAGLPGCLPATSLTGSCGTPSSQEARTLGLVDEVHPAEALERRVRALAGQIATFAPLTLAAAKEATRRILAAFTVREAEDLLLSCYLSEDFQEGVRAFLGKRRAEWKGR